MYDVGIVGAGPAGAVLARLLAGRCRILLLDNGRTKCCGGILAPESQKMLAKLDLALPREVLVDPQPFAVAVWDLESRLIRHYARQYINIDRAAFDRWLRSLIPGSVDIRSGAVYRWSEPEKDGFKIFFTEQGESRSEQVRFLVGADGAFSTVRREFFSNRLMPKQYAALQDWFDWDAVCLPKHGINFQNDYVGIFDSGVTDFYAWTIPKNGHLIFGGAVPYEEKPREKFELLKTKLETLGLRFGAPCHREAGQLLRPLRFSSIYSGSDRVILLGEAAGLISPSSAEGISSALASAYFLSLSFERNGFDIPRYRRYIRSLRWNLWLKSVKIPAMFCPRLRKQIMRSGLTVLDRTNRKKEPGGFLE